MRWKLHIITISVIVKLHCANRVSAVICMDPRGFGAASRSLRL